MLKATKKCMLLCAAALAILTLHVKCFVQQSNAESKPFNAALFQAAEAGDTDVINCLLIGRKAISFETCVDADKMTPLMTALFHGNVATATAIASFCDEASVKQVDAFAYNAVSYAACQKADGFVRAMIARGVACNIEAKDGTFPLLNAANAASGATVDALLPHLTMEDVNRASKKHPRQNALIVACIRRCTPAVKSLLEKGASVHVYDANGHSPLQIAAIYGYGDVLQLLIAQIKKNEAIDHKDLVFALSYAKDPICKKLLQDAVSSLNFTFSVRNKK